MLLECGILGNAAQWRSWCSSELCWRDMCVEQEDPHRNMVVRVTLMNSTQVQQLFREHYHNYGINTGIVLLSPGDYKRTYEGTAGKLGQTSTNFQVKRGKSARNIGIDTSSSTQHRFRPGIPPSMSCQLVSAVTLFAGSRVIETVRNTTRPGVSSNIADCLSRCWNKIVYLLANCKENMIWKRRRDTKGDTHAYEARRR